MASGSDPESRRRAFGKALKSALHVRGMSQTELGAQLGGMAQSAISAWTNGQAEPERDTVFLVERLLGVPAGHLSRHLGYLPLTSSKITEHTLEQAIEADPDLDTLGRRILLGTYRELIEANKPRRGRKARK